MPIRSTCGIYMFDDAWTDDNGTEAGHIGPLMLPAAHAIVRIPHVFKVHVFLFLVISAQH